MDQSQAPEVEVRLDSWKEIGAYLKRGTRTLQRWEREKGLPVHRLRADKLGSVFAFKTELDAWWSARGAQVAAGPSIAVLPFADMSPARDQAYFCEGLAEEIIHALSRAGLQVAARTSSFQLRSTAMDSRQIGRKLGVGALLEGSVRTWDSQMRVAVQVVETRKGFPLWSASYDRATGDVLAVQEELAAQIAAVIERVLTPQLDEEGQADAVCAGRTA